MSSSGEHGSSSDDDGLTEDTPPNSQSPPPSAGGAQVACIFLGKRDGTTRESAKADRHEAIRKTMRRNPGWVPLDGIGHRVQVDAKTNEVKRIVPSRDPQLLHMSGASGAGGLRGAAAMQEFSKPIGAHQGEYERLARMGVACDPGREYVMDTTKAHDARRYVGGAGRGSTDVAVEMRYDLDTHIASKAGYRMFGGGVGFVHTNGAVSRVLAGPGGGGVCACGLRHVA